MSAATAPMGSVADFSIYQKLNSVWHRRALNLFMFIVLAHWAEHLARLIRFMYWAGLGRRREVFLVCFFPGS